MDTAEKTTLPEKEDPRVRKTRLQLRQAMMELLGRKSVQEITVRELTRLADVNRGTFYRHYRDIYDFLEKTEEGLIAEFTAVLDAYSNESLRIGLVPILTDVFTFARRNAGLCEALLDMRVDQRFFQRLSGLLYERCVGEWQGLYALGEIERGSYVLEFVMAGAVSLIRTWTARGFDRTPEEMARLADRLIRRGLGEIRAQG
ncbi:TetR/AcrR family transcriptional regulator [Pseudoflavonifractor phocaeensis]|uniref:TetR/AcrR family transcriptional regulator n=1 Tax=Pseudoflavonifractor phocaeensis TaxID=1870988 RepID=UPI0019587E63|nr:TetR/AcrR family transcriptional regulator [Pseudoflavonifractor phocaeensis]MBM6871138.1 TetR/AcrR family transcriptional regulator C-terminal domain-containing protein [Pseudoflavonifractor phocaeensis]